MRGVVVEHRFLWAAAIVSTGLSVSGCDEKKAEDQYTLIEYVKIEGRCHENHAQEWGSYRGSIVHWHNDTQGTDSRYGSVTNWNAFSGEAMLENTEHPNRYHPPFIVMFWEVPAEMLAKQQMVLAGISEPLGDENSKVPGYESTCEVAVVSRAHEFPPDADRW